MPKRASPDSSQSPPPPSKRSSFTGIMDDKESKAVATSSGGSSLGSDTRYLHNGDPIHATGTDGQKFFHEEKYSVMGNSTSNMARTLVPIRYKTPERSQPIQGLLPSPVSPTPPERVLRPSGPTSQSSYPPDPAILDVEMADSPESLVYPPTPQPNRPSLPPSSPPSPALPPPAPSPEEHFEFDTHRAELINAKSAQHRMNEYVKGLENKRSNDLIAKQNKAYAAICDVLRQRHEVECQVQQLQTRKSEMEREADWLAERNKAAKAELEVTKGEICRAKQEKEASIREAQDARQEAEELKQSLRDALEDEKQGAEAGLQLLRQKEAEERATIVAQTDEARIEADKTISELNQEKEQREVEVQHLQEVITDLQVSKAGLCQDTKAAQDSLDRMLSAEQMVKGHLQSVLLHVQMRSSC